ncbi:hypothetical protein GCM10009660_24220 [Catellatospora bangladeshensis]
MDEFIREPEAKLDALGAVDEIRDVVDGEADPDEEYGHAAESPVIGI